MSDTPNTQYRLRKKNETEIFGPMDFKELQSLVDSAYVAPEDEVSEDGEIWKLANEWEALEMVWKVHMADGQFYGPTSIGTIKEFFRAEELNKDQSLTHAQSGETTTVAELLGEEFLSEIEAAQSQASPAFPAELDEPLDVARELRIQQLEADLEKTKKDYDLLMHQYRRVSEELLQLKKKN
jgi:hypothetical protein